jgi:hypothetical protein
MLAACPPKQVPLDAMHMQLEQLDRLPMPDGWASQATIVLSAPLVQTLVDRGAESARGQIVPITIPGPLGIELHAEPKPDVPQLTLNPSDACVGCVGVDIGWTGTIGLELAGVGGDVGWRSTVDATVSLDGRPVDDGFAIALVPVAPDQWDVDLEVLGLPPAYNALLSQVLGQRLEAAKTAGPLAHPIPLATVPGDGAVRLRSVRSRFDQGLAFDLGFSTLNAGSVLAVPDPGPGFAVVLPADTLAGIATAALLRAGPQHGYLPEVTAMHLADGRFELWVRVWHVAHRQKWREFVLRGAIGLDDQGGLAFATDDVVQTGKLGGGGFLDPVVKTVILDALQKSTAVTVPGRYVHTMGTTALVVDVTRVEADHDVLTVWGLVH